MRSGDRATRFHTAVGTDPAFCEMIGFNVTAAISCTTKPKSPDRFPGLYTIHLDGAERSFSYSRSFSAAWMMMSDPDRLWRKVAAADLIYLSGINLAILSPEESEFLVRKLRSHLKKAPGLRLIRTFNRVCGSADDGQKRLEPKLQAC